MITWFHEKKREIDIMYNIIIVYKKLLLMLSNEPNA